MTRAEILGHGMFSNVFCYRGSGQKAAREARGKCCGCENSSEISREESREGHEIALEGAAAAVSLQILGAPWCSPVQCDKANATTPEKMVYNTRKIWAEHLGMLT